MSIITATRGLTREEQVLHHFAAMVKDDLNAYQASGSIGGGATAQLALWETALRTRLVFLILSCTNITRPHVLLGKGNELLCLSPK
jgi:hypothetical protein